KSVPACTAPPSFTTPSAPPRTVPCASAPATPPHATKSTKPSPPSTKFSKNSADRHHWLQEPHPTAIPWRPRSRWWTATASSPARVAGVFSVGKACSERQQAGYKEAPQPTAAVRPGSAIARGKGSPTLPHSLLSLRLILMSADRLWVGAGIGTALTEAR